MHYARHSCTAHEWRSGRNTSPQVAEPPSKSLFRHIICCRESALDAFVQIDTRTAAGCVPAGGGSVPLRRQFVHLHRRADATPPAARDEPKYPQWKPQPLRPASSPISGPISSSLVRRSRHEHHARDALEQPGGLVTPLRRGGAATSRTCPPRLAAAHFRAKAPPAHRDHGDSGGSRDCWRAARCGGSLDQRSATGCAMSGDGINLVKVFSASKARDRDALGERITEWIANHAEIQILKTIVALSSDLEFHCLSIVMFCNERSLAPN